MKSSFGTLRCVLLAVCSLLVTISAGAFSGGPDPAKTGGFGEMTCHQSGCHVSFDLNEGRANGLGDLVISGRRNNTSQGGCIRSSWRSLTPRGRAYWGFQLAARLKETGAQAGELKPMDGSTQILVEKGIQYIEHTLKGIAANTFEFTWVAPDRSAGEVIMHASGNAADGNATSEGDYIYNMSISIAGPPR